MPIRLLLLYGSMGGLASVLVAALLRPLLSPGKRTGGTLAASSPLELSWPEVADASLHLIAGAGIGMLYWLSWGFAAIVSVPWWIRGLSFGVTCFAAIALPLLVAVALKAKMQPRLLGALLLDWSYTCTLAALACAWSSEAAQ